MIAIRNCVLSEEDIIIMRKNYKNNPYVEPEVLEPSNFLKLNSLDLRKSLTNNLWSWF